MKILNSYNKIDITGEKASKPVVIGGILGETDTEDVSIINSYNVGDLEGNYTGGICGLISTINSSASNLKIHNSYNVGNIVGTIRASGIVGCNSKFATIEIQNAYYLSGTATAGVQNYEQDNTTVLETSYMQSHDFVNTLNNNLSYIESSVKLNEWECLKNNYPIYKKL